MTARIQVSSNRFACLVVAVLAVISGVQSTLAEKPAANEVDHEVSVKIELLEDAVPATSPAAVESHGDAEEAIDIAFGDPVGLRVVVANESDEPTEPMPCSLHPAWMAATVVVVHPDGRKSLGPLNDPRDFCVMPEIRSFEAGERLSADLFACTDYRSELRHTAEMLRFGYLFPEPGDYEVYVVYSTKLLYADPKELDWIGWFLRRVERGDGLVVSNKVRVRVGEAFAGWEELREAGLVRALRFGYWESPDFADEESRAKIDALVEQSDRAWLKAWYAEVEKRPPYRPTMP